VWNPVANADTDSNTYCNLNTDAQAYSYTQAAPDSTS
jgi:hypothetical protein